MESWRDNFNVHQKHYWKIDCKFHNLYHTCFWSAFCASTICVWSSCKLLHRVITRT